jgi:hypothetical protein
MKYFKNTKLTFFSIILMLVIVTYLNYEYNPEREKNLGQTVYVNSKEAETVDIYKEDKKEDNSYEYSKKEDSIAVFKYDRDNMFSELLSNYTSIISNENTPKEKITEYQTKLNDLLIKKNLIIMVENIIKSKGIKDVVIIPTNNDNLNVVIKSEQDIKKEDMAKIQQTLMDQFNIKADKITITVQK